jgi:hypothetical protein
VCCDPLQTAVAGYFLSFLCVYIRRHSTVKNYVAGKLTLVCLFDLLVSLSLRRGPFRLTKRGKKSGRPVGRWSRVVEVESFIFFLPVSVETPAQPWPVVGLSVRLDERSHRFFLFYFVFVFVLFFNREPSARVYVCSVQCV